MSAAAQVPAGGDEPMVLEARALRRRFGAVAAVDGLDLAIRRGELYGLVGPDGAGKTTTIRLLTSLMDPDEGEIFVLGRVAKTGGEAVREAIGYMPQQYSLYGDLSVDENLQFFARLFGLSRAVFAERRLRLLRITRLERFGGRRADALSGGMYKKLALSCALLHQPQALILDEPTNGVDPVSRRELWDLLYELIADGMTVLVATPYMDEAERCHRVGLMHRGALLTEGDPRELTGRFEHASFILQTRDRQALEQALSERGEVLSLTPHGASLRVVVRGDRSRIFADWLAASGAAEAVERVRPDFEDVFLGLLARQRQA